MSQSNIRNFCAISHIDHGKSTLADRFLELTGTVTKREMHEQMLDSNPIERERGITIKLAPVRMEYKRFKNYDLGFRMENTDDSKLLNRKSYILNLIDTPGHVDFSYEVSRSLAACEGAILIVDASQGVQAQTLAHLAQARAHKLAVIPVINKIDLPNARIEESEREIYDLGFKNQEIIKISAKTGENVEKVLEAIVERIPAPKGNAEGPLRVLVFSSQYDPHKGVVVFVRVVDGAVSRQPSAVSQVEGRKLKAESVLFMASRAIVAPVEIGYFTPRMTSGQALLTGEVGYIATGLKDVKLAKVGDTITLVRNNLQPMTNNIQPLPGYQEPKPMVFLGLYPVDASEYTLAREAMERLRLSDSAFTFRPISSLALGNGFHCGFLGLLHAEIVQERISREFGLTLIATAPSVEYRVRLRSSRAEVARPISRVLRSLPSDAEGRAPSAEGSKLSELPALQREISIQSAAEFPDPSLIEEVREPIMQVKIFTPKRFVGAIMQLAAEKRGEYIDLKYFGDQAEFTYLIPLAEMIIDFFDRLKSISEGYASLDYEFFDFQPVDVVKVDILVNKEKVDALAFLSVRDQAHHRAIAIVDRLGEVIPRQQFEIPIQAAIGGQIAARADVKPFRKDVTAKLYGGDRTRKDKLLDKQKKGKAKMKVIGRVEIPQAAFFEVLKRQ